MMWNLSIVVASGALLLSSATGQQRAGQSEEARLAALRDQKLSSPFLKRTGWVTEFDKAKAKAEEKRLPIVIYFTRSYAPSPPCKAIENTLFSTEEFAKLSSKAVFFCHITSKVKTDEHQDLLSRLGGDSFPHMVVTDAAGRRIAGVDGIRSVEDIASVLDREVAAFSRLRARAAKGDKKAKADYFIKRLQLGHLGPKAIQKELQTADYLSVEQRRVIRRSLASLEVMEILRSVDEKNPESVTSAAKRMLLMMRAGRVPSGRLAFPFWQVLLGHADQTGNPDLFDTALRNIKKIPAVASDKKWLKHMEIQLEAMRILADVDKERPDSIEAGGEKMLAMVRKGRIPHGGIALPFWSALLSHADHTEDAGLFETALKSLKKIKGATKDKSWLTRMELRLRALRFMKRRKKGGE